MTQTVFVGLKQMHPHKEIVLLHTFLPFFFRWAAFPLPIFSFASSLMFRISPCSTPPITSVNPACRSLWSSCCPHCERLPQKRPFRSEVKIVPWRVGVRVRKREDCSDALSLLFFFTFTKHTHTSKHARWWSTPTSLSAVRNWRLSPAHSEAGRGGWRDRGRGGRRGGGGGCLWWRKEENIESEGVYPMVDVVLPTWNWRLETLSQIKGTTPKRNNIKMHSRKWTRGGKKW